MQCSFNRLLALVFAGCSACLGACQPSQALVETYTRPAEIDMTNKDYIVVEDITGKGGRPIEAKVRVVLHDRDIRVLDRSSFETLLAEQRLNTVLGDGAGTELSVRQAGLLIKGEMLQNSVKTDRLRDRHRNADGSFTNSYAHHAIVNYEVSFNVVDLHSSELRAAAVISANQEKLTQWSENPLQIDTASMISQCQDEIADRFARKLAPYNVKVEHKAYPVKGVPRSAQGIAALQSQDDDRAIDLLTRSLADGRADAKVSKKRKKIGYLAHNLAVAYEMDGQFNEALRYYSEADMLGVGSDRHIKRCHSRIADQKIFSQQESEI